MDKMLCFEIGGIKGKELIIIVIAMSNDFATFQIMKKRLLITFSFSPLLVFAEGQYGLILFWDLIDLVKVLIIWVVVVFSSITIWDRLSPEILDKRKKRKIWLATGLIALFLWSMIKHDSNPNVGPIDSIF